MNDIDQVRRFPVLWGLLTASYALAVVHRGLVESVRPGLPTFAGFSAIAAVWLGFYEVIRSRHYLRVAIVIALLATVLLNTATIVRSALRGFGVSVEQSAFTIIFIYVLLGKVRDLLPAQSPVLGKRSS